MFSFTEDFDIDPVHNTSDDDEEEEEDKMERMERRRMAMLFIFKFHGFIASLVSRSLSSDFPQFVKFEILSLLLLLSLSGKTDFL